VDVRAAASLFGARNGTTTTLPTGDGDDDRDVLPRCRGPRAPEYRGRSTRTSPDATPSASVTRWRQQHRPLASASGVPGRRRSRS
jgi:hypothetical protein